jgi:hypothetical protein
MSTKTTTDPAAAAIAATAATAVAVSAAYVTPKTGITNVYSRTTTDQISNLKELLTITNDSLEFQRRNLSFIDWEKMPKGQRTKKDYERKILDASKLVAKHKAALTILKERKAKEDSETKF